MDTDSENERLPQISDLAAELRSIAREWHQLGIQLQVPCAKLDKIDEDYSTCDRKLTAVLQYWLDNDKDPSWDKILEALRRIGGFGRMLQTIKLKYCSLQRLHTLATYCLHCHQQHGKSGKI